MWESYYLYQIHLTDMQCSANIIIIGPKTAEEVYITLTVERR